MNIQLNGQLVKCINYIKEKKNVSVMSNGIIEKFIVSIKGERRSN